MRKAGEAEGHVEGAPQPGVGHPVPAPPRPGPADRLPVHPGRWFLLSRRVVTFLAQLLPREAEPVRAWPAPPGCRVPSHLSPGGTPGLRHLAAARAPPVHGPLVSVLALTRCVGCYGN